MIKQSAILSGKGNKTISEKIQILRAIAIFCVVLIHTCPGGMVSVMVRPLLNIGVATFLFMSGFLTRVPVRDVPRFYLKRIERVLIPYIIWSIIYSLVQGGTNLNGMMMNILLAQSGPQFYYILVYIQLVVLTPFVYRLLISRFKNIGWIISPISVLLFIYIPLISRHPLTPLVDTFWKNGCLGWFTYYYLGIGMGNKLIKASYSSKKVTRILLLSLTLQIIEGYYFCLLHSNNCGSQLKLSSLLTNCLFLLLVYKWMTSKRLTISKKIQKIMVKIGDHSFGIYLCHILVMIELQKAFPHYFNCPFPLNGIIVFLISYFLIRIVCLVVSSKIVKALGFC